MNRSFNERHELKTRAKKMLLEQDLTQKEIARRLGTSEKTISTWAKTHGWKASKEKALTIEGGIPSVHGLTGLVDLQGFAAFLLDVDPKCYESMRHHLFNYLFSLLTDHRGRSPSQAIGKPDGLNKA